MAPEQPELLEDDAGEQSLDAGLRAAFGPAESRLEGPPSVLAQLGELSDDTRIELPDPDAAGAGALEDGSGRRSTAGRYEPRAEIGRGAMGVIVRTRDADLGRDVAMKVLHPRHAESPSMVQRFIEEARIAGQLQHPGVLQVYELGLQADRRPYFTMKLIKGKTLAALLIARTGPTEDRRRFLSVFEDICQTMAYAHARGVIHRDLKPANVMVGNFGEVQIVDWGLAKLVDRAGDAAAIETVIDTGRADETGTESLAGSVMGTPAYMPPEQARGEVERLDARSDVFALGAILCEILTGRPPYEGVDALDAARRGRLAGAWARLDAADADPELRDLARRCLQPEPADRPAHAGEVAAAVTRHLASLEERARASALAAAAARARADQERRARRLTVALALSVVAVIGVGAGGFIVNQSQRLRELAVNSQLTSEALEEATRHLEAARRVQSPTANSTPWINVRAAGGSLAALREADRLDEETATRVDSFLDELTSVDRDRRMVERIEELVIIGATHEDRESWIRMEDQLREAFREYGIDLETTDRSEIARRISRSALAPQLADGLELWIATVAHLGSMGVSMLDRQELLGWMEVLYEADPDPFRTAIRRQIASGQPDLLVLHRLRASPEFDEALPRTLSWLGNAFFLAGDLEAADDVYRRALHLYPNDFMLNFDYGLQLKTLERWGEAVTYFRAALAVRPETGGIWRTLGVALRESGKLDEAIMALRTSVRHQADYAPTHVELGRTLARRGDLDGALDAYRQALDIRPDHAEAHCFLGLALQQKGRLVEALLALERGHELGTRNATWPHPSDEWIRGCLRLIEVRLNQTQE